MLSLASILTTGGAERAREALAYLEDISARRTARWLWSALQATEDAAALERLDNQFFDKPQDLSSSVVRHLSKRPRR